MTEKAYGQMLHMVDFILCLRNVDFVIRTRAQTEGV